jgi:hypothetical protein
MSTTFSGPVISTAGFTGDVTGAVTGDVTGNVTGNLTGNVFGGIEELNSDGSLSVAKLFSVVGSDGSVATAFSLPNGSAGQMKVIKYNDGTQTTAAVVTPANLIGGSTLTFDAKAEAAILISDGSSWHIVYNSSTLGA